MQPLTEYMQPLTLWLYAHPYWALFITFLISLSESLAVIGSIVPGSVTMTAIGILAGSGIMRTDLTLIAATLGAIAGDSLSYLLGYTLSDRLANIWPFSRYPQWLDYGKAYFARHGGKSVLIGRFVGPLRSMIPVIAGMMHMQRWHFFLANISSAIGWSILYVAPGVFIGAVSTELSPDVATRLIGLILILLVAIWITTHALKWVFSSMNQWIKTRLQTLWEWIEHKPRAIKLIEMLACSKGNKTTPYESYQALMLFLAFIFFFSLSMVFIAFVAQQQWMNAINQPVFYFLQTLRIHSINNFFIFFSLTTRSIPFIILIASFMFLTAYNQNWRLLKYTASLMFISYGGEFLLNTNFSLPALIDLHEHIQQPTFPPKNLMPITAFLSFLLLYSYQNSRPIVYRSLQFFILTLLGLSGIAASYLGNNWLTNILAGYAIGLTLSLFHWILYRRQPTKHPLPEASLWVLIIVFVSAIFLEARMNFKHLQHQYYPDWPKYVVSEEIWWHQQQPLLPLYTMNRLGKRTNLLNIQYAGDLGKFAQALSQYGWEKQPNSFFSSLLMRMSGQDIDKELLSMTQLYLNKIPSLTMSYQEGKKQGLYILRLWCSNYRLLHERKPIWIGSIIYAPKKLKYKHSISQTMLFKHLLPALNTLMYTSVTLPDKNIPSLPANVPPQLLIIRDPLPLTLSPQTC